VAFTLPLEASSGFLQRQIRDKQITDLVIYYDTRPFHKTAIQGALAKGINVHIFEEGYLRPYWITYERDGSNGNSKLMSLAQSAVVPDHLISNPDPVPAPCHWGICASIFFMVPSIIGAFCTPIINFPILPRIERSVLRRSLGFI
jgi:capsular polysaccharide export protein